VSVGTSWFLRFRRGPSRIRFRSARHGSVSDHPVRHVGGLFCRHAPNYTPNIGWRVCEALRSVIPYSFAWQSSWASLQGSARRPSDGVSAVPQLGGSREDPTPCRSPSLRSRSPVHLPTSRPGPWGVPGVLAGRRVGARWTVHTVHAEGARWGACRPACGKARERAWGLHLAVVQLRNESR